MQKIKVKNPDTNEVRKIIINESIKSFEDVKAQVPKFELIFVFVDSLPSFIADHLTLEKMSYREMIQACIWLEHHGELIFRAALEQTDFQYLSDYLDLEDSCINVHKNRINFVYDYIKENHGVDLGTFPIPIDHNEAFKHLQQHYIECVQVGEEVITFDHLPR